MALTSQKHGETYAVLEFGTVIKTHVFASRGFIQWGHYHSRDQSVFSGRKFGRIPFGFGPVQ